jgi:hypothetical protein
MLCMPSHSIPNPIYPSTLFRTSILTLIVPAVSRRCCR